MGIQGSNIKQELSLLTRGLPCTFHQAAEQLQSKTIGGACSYYAAFVAATLSSDSSGSHSAAELLPAIHRVREARLEAEAPAPDHNASGMSEQTREVQVGDATESATDTADSAAGAEPQGSPAGILHQLR